MQKNIQYITKYDPYKHISQKEKLKCLKMPIKIKKSLTNDQINLNYFLQSPLHEEILKYLNNEQAEIVLQTEGSILVSAVPGAGKTKVISCKVAYLIDYLKVDPNKILVITFTKKASVELRERIGNMISSDNEDSVVLGTFHSICNKFIRSLGIVKNFTVLDVEQQNEIVCDMIKIYNDNDEPSSSSQKKLATEILNIISAAKNSLQTAEDYKKVSTNFLYSNVYSAYETHLKNHNYLDFDDLLIKLIFSVRNNSTTREHIFNRFTYVFIDEFQDTNALQFEIISYFAKRTLNITAVGDSDQSIYGWRFADSKIIDKFKNTFPSYKLCQLEQNYRSTKNIIKCAHSVIDQDTYRLKKQIWTDNNAGEKVSLHIEATLDDEAKHIADKIKHFTSKGIKYENMVILLRQNFQTRAFETVFTKENIPYQLMDSKDFYKSNEVQYVLSFLRFIVNKKDIFSFRETSDLCVSYTNIVTKEMETNEWVDIIRGTHAEKLSDYVKIISSCDLMVKNKAIVSDIILHILKETDYKKRLENEHGSSIAEQKWENISELVNFATRYYTIESFLMDTQLTLASTGKVIAGGKVSILTMHSAKGLEWDIVFIPSVVEGLIPHEKSISSIDKTNSIAEERRLLFVAMTRARMQLFLSYCRIVMTFGKKEVVAISRFLEKLPVDSVQKN